jgi:hypothetical protein
MGTSFWLPLPVRAEEAEYGTDDVVDHRSSEPLSGNTTPTDWFIPNIPDPDKADPDEYRDYLGQVDSPYAFLKLPFAFQYAGQTVPAGFYLVKFDMPNATPRPARRRFGIKGPKLFYPPVYPTQVSPSSSQVGLMLKKEGEIVIMLPIQETLTFAPPPKPKWYQFGKRVKAQLAASPEPRAELLPVANHPQNPQGFQVVYCHTLPETSVCYRSVPLNAQTTAQLMTQTPQSTAVRFVSPSSRP